MRVTTGGLDQNGSEYIQYQGADALSVIDEGNLETIAGQLGVEYEHREAGVAPSLPAAPSSTTAYADAGEVGNVIELYWVAALVILAALAVELTRATILVARLRGLRVPRAGRSVPPHTPDGARGPGLPADTACVPRLSMVLCYPSQALMPSTGSAEADDCDTSLSGEARGRSSGDVVPTWGRPSEDWGTHMGNSAVWKRARTGVAGAIAG